MKRYKVLFADLDGTLITTVSGKTFPEDCTDFRIRKEVLDKINSMEGLRYVVIVTNQGGIPEHVSRHDFESKIHCIAQFMDAYLYDPEVYWDYCYSMDKEHPCRKPNTGMLQEFLDVMDIRNKEKLVKDNILMIGDASGKTGQFSDSDKKCAENFGIDYMDVEDFVACNFNGSEQKES